MLSAAKHLAAHRERCFAALSMTSDPRLLPVVLVKLLYRPTADVPAPTLACLIATPSFPERWQQCVRGWGRRTVLTGGCAVPPGEVPFPPSLLRAVWRSRGC